MKDGNLKNEYYAMIDLVDPHIKDLSAEERCEIEMAFADVAALITKMQEELETYKVLISFMREWNLTPEETIRLLKMTGKFKEDK